MVPSKLDWFPSTIEAFEGKNGHLWIFNALWNLTRKYVIAPLLRFIEILPAEEKMGTYGFSMRFGILREST